MITIKHKKDRGNRIALARIEPTPGHRTGEYFHHPHDIRTAFYGELKSQGYKKLSENIAISRGGAQISLSARLSQEAIVSDFDYSPSFGLTMGSNGRHRISVYSGGVTPEGAAFVIGKRIAPKFSPYFKLKTVAEEMVAGFHADMIAADRCVRNLQENWLDKEDVTVLLMNACQNHWMRHVDLPECWTIWESGENQSAWLLLRAFSLAIRDSSPYLQLERLYQFSLSLHDPKIPHIVSRD